MGNQQVRQTIQDLLKIPETDYYYADADGEVYSTKRSSSPKKLAKHRHYGRSKNPYIRICFESKMQLQHRVVASIHVGRKLFCEEVVNHIDGDTTNNKLCNLEVVSQAENVKHATENNLYCSGDDWYKARDMKGCL